MYNYLEDIYANTCLELAKQCKTDVGFGAVLVKDNEIIGLGRNRLSTLEERKEMSHVDYAIHAEQACILDAKNKGFDVIGGQIYVFGMCLRGKNKGKTTVKTEKVFICTKCPHALIKYNISVNIPHINGWVNIFPEESLEIGKRYYHTGYWKEFVNV